MFKANDDRGCLYSKNSSWYKHSALGLANGKASICGHYCHPFIEPIFYWTVNIQMPSHWGYRERKQILSLQSTYILVKGKERWRYWWVPSVIEKSSFVGGKKLPKAKSKRTWVGQSWWTGREGRPARVGCHWKTLSPCSDFIARFPWTLFLIRPWPWPPALSLACSTSPVLAKNPAKSV